MPPLPTTALMQSAFPVSEPHGETHDENGVDPVIPSLRIVKVVGLSAASGFTTEDTLVEFDIVTRGGNLIIDLNTELVADANTSRADPLVRINLYIDGGYISGNSLQVNGSTEVDIDFTNPCVLRWVYFPTDINPLQPLFGKHTIKLTIQSNSANVAASYSGGHIVVTEFNPQRRD